MLSIRSLARSAPRTLGRLSRQSAVARSAFVKPTASLSSAFRTQSAPSFSTTAFRKAAESDEELVAKLESELQFEEEVKQNEQVPASVKDFLNNSAFELQDTPGKEDVKLVRSFGEEK
jgi:complement component 1 Q subcomponent-binding protein